MNRDTITVSCSVCDLKLTNVDGTQPYLSCGQTISTEKLLGQICCPSCISALTNSSIQL